MAPIMKDAVQKTLRMGGFGRAVPPPRQSLTQQFFLDGERQEAEGWKAVPPPPDVVETDPEMHFDSFDRVPRRHRALKAGLALSLGVALAGLLWTVGKPFLEGTGRQVASGMMKRLETGRAAAPEAKTEVAARVTPSASAVIGAPPRPESSAAAVEEQPSASGAAREASAIVAMPARPSPSTPAPAASQVVTAREAPRAAIRDTQRADPDGIAEVHRHAIRVMPVRPTGSGDNQPEPLRGFVWSPSAKAMLPVEPGAPTTEPPPADTAPPPSAVTGDDLMPPQGVLPAEPLAPPASAAAPAPGSSPGSVPILDP